MSGPLTRSNVNDVIYDADGAREGRYGCTQGPIWAGLNIVLKNMFF